MIMAINASVIKMARIARQLKSQRKNRTSVLRSQIEGGTWSAILGHCGWELNFAAASRHKNLGQDIGVGAGRIDQLRNLPAVLAQRHQQLARRGLAFSHTCQSG